MAEKLFTCRLKTIIHSLTLPRLFICKLSFYLGLIRRWAVVVMIVLPVQSVPITTKAMSSNPVHGEVHSIQYYAIKFVSDLRQVSGFLRVLRFPPTIKLTAPI